VSWDVQTWGVAVAAAQAALLFAAAVIAWIAIASNRKGARRQTVIGYFERYWSREFVYLTHVVLRDLGLDPPATQAATEAQRLAFRTTVSEHRQLQLYRLVNFFEELGTVYVAGQLDADLTLEMFGGHAVQVWEQLAWKVTEIRTPGSERFLSKWLLLVEAARQPRPDPDGPWVLHTAIARRLGWR